jgi:hypothetical protein
VRTQKPRAHWMRSVGVLVLAVLQMEPRYTTMHELLVLLIRCS